MERGGMNAVPLRVFLSHTAELAAYPPGRSFVAAAQATLTRTGNVSTDMAYFTAREQHPADYCRQQVQQADVYVGIIGFRYGSSVRDQPELSYTELEFNIASEQQLPRLIFLLDEDAVLPLPLKYTFDPRFEERQQAFRARLKAARVTVQPVQSPDQLELKLFQALGELRWQTAQRIAAGLQREQQPPQQSPARQAAAHETARSETRARSQMGTSRVFMPEREPYDVFLSSSASDVAFARALALRLREAGLRVFFGEDSVRAGENIRHAIDDAVRSAAVAVVLIGPAASSSKWVSAEVTAATSASMTGQLLLVPVLVGDADDAQVQDALRRFRAVRAAAPEDLEQAADAIGRAVIAAGRRPSSQPSPPPLPALPGDYVDTGASHRILAAIDASVRQRSGPVQVIGPPGAGKTTETVAACRAAADRYEILGWIVATTEHAVIRGLAQLARSIGVRDDGTGDADLAVAAIDRLANADTRWLLVFDDADVRDRWLEQWIPPASETGTAVVTSRYEMPLRAPIVQLTGLDTASALRFLESRLRTPIDDKARLAVLRLLAEIGDTMPLTLAVVAGQLASDDDPIEERTDRLLMKLREHPSWNRTSDVSAVAAASFRSVTKRHPAAARIWQVLALAGGTPIPAALLREAADDPFLASDTEEVVQALDELAAHGFIQTTSGVIVAHPVLTEDVQLDATAAEPLRFLERAVTRRRNIERPDSRELTLTTDLARHALTRAAQTGSPEATVAAAQLCLEVALVLRDGGDVSGAVALLEQTLLACQAALGPDHRTTLSTLTNLAGALQAAGRMTEAAAVWERTLVESELVLGPDDPTTLSTRANLGAVLRSAGRVGEAAAVWQRTLADSERVLGPEHPSTLALRADVAVALQAAGRIDEATALLERTLADSERVLGPEYPSTLAVRANLAGALQEAGRAEEATALLAETLVDTERVLGPEHPSTLAVRANLAAALQAVGRVYEAAVLLEQTLAASERLLGPDHSLTATLRENLQYVRGAHGRSG